MQYVGKGARSVGKWVVYVSDILLQVQNAKAAWGRGESHVLRAEAPRRMRWPPDQAAEDANCVLCPRQLLFSHLLAGGPPRSVDSCRLGSHASTRF
jgi:hypothetical protein